jgi:methyl-accepting chemotaxis protein
MALTMRQKLSLAFFLITFITSIIFGIFLYQSQKNQFYSSVDKQLVASVEALDLILGGDFVDKYTKDSPMDKDEYYQLVKKLTKYSQDIGVAYVYLFVKDGSDVFMPVCSSTDKQIADKSYDKFMTKYEANDKTKSSFQNGKSLFGETNDEYGHLRNYLSARVSPKGRVYMVGTDIDIGYIDSELNSILYKVLGIVALVLVIVSVITLFVTRQIKNILTSLFKELTNISNGLLESATTINQSSDMLSNSASHQASTVEEITATVEEANANTQQNSDNASVASKLSLDINQYAKDGYDEVLVLQDAMGEITESSNQISNIIKTIDEMAFQTNLLSLNAAVEAARAGEHGLGFAVVAEEVRALANRSAGAAKETSHIISKSIDSVQEGNNINDRVNKAFKEIVEKIEENTNLISEISTSSKELSVGMNQISGVLTDIDSATQNMASTSQELSASAHELKNNAKDMDDTLIHYNKLI